MNGGVVTYITSYPVCLHAFKPTHIIEVHIAELRFLDHFAVETTFQLHHQKQHLVVGAAWKKNFACVEFIECAAHGPDIQRRVIGNPQDWLKRKRK